jgi:hypothetical protein
VTALGPISGPFRQLRITQCTPRHPTHHVRTVQCRTPNTNSISDVVKRLAAATGLVVGDALAGGDVDVCFRVVGGDAAAHALLNLARHRQEGLLDVARVLGRCLKEGNSEAVGKLLQNDVRQHCDTRAILTLGSLECNFGAGHLTDTAR